MIQALRDIKNYSAITAVSVAMHHDHWILVLAVTVLLFAGALSGGKRGS